MAAVWAAHAADDADATQAAQQLDEVGLGNLLAGGDLGALHRPLPIAAGKLDDGMGAVVATHGKSQS